MIRQRIIPLILALLLASGAFAHTGHGEEIVVENLDAFIANLSASDAESAGMEREFGDLAELRDKRDPFFVLGQRMARAAARDCPDGCPEVSIDLSQDYQDTRLFAGVFQADAFTSSTLRVETENVPEADPFVISAGAQHRWVEVRPLPGVLAEARSVKGIRKIMLAKDWRIAREEKLFEVGAQSAQ